MAYKYITDNNLYQTQDYMYSEYGGVDFIREYISSRRTYLESPKGAGNAESRKKESNAVREELRDILKNLKSSAYDEEVICSVDVYAKRFEIRKKIYTKYDRNKKPFLDAGFEDYESYLLLADCLLFVYRKKRCLKYFSCLLKIDDTLLSMQDKLGEEEREYLRKIIRQELDIFYLLAQENGIGKETAE